jgi:hypothetical protein
MTSPMVTEPITEPITEPTDTAAIDPARMVESLLAELDFLLELHPELPAGELVTLHAALALFNVEGDVSRLPTPRLAFSARAGRERRLLRTARQLAAHAGTDPVRVTEQAALAIECRLGLIDPELLAFVA